MMDITDFSLTRPPRARALIPFGVFLLFYLGLSIVSGDFYKVPMPIAFIVASATALVLDHKSSLKSKIELFAHGMGNVDIMTMCLIFILAGSFAYTAKAMGAVDAAVNIALAFVPANLLVCGLFLVACFISISIGTSVGTIVALAPIAIGLTESVGISLGLCLGSVVGGAMFGDNLSMISDTTIAATRSQRCEMRDKFRVNFLIALPAALITLVLLLIFGRPETVMPLEALPFDLIKVLPYVLVLVLALCGLNVFLALTVGIFSAGLVGICCGDLTIAAFAQSVWDGFTGMNEVFFLTLLCGGMSELIAKNGGIAWIIQKLRKVMKGNKSAQVGIAAMVSLCDCATANNTVAIIVAGDMARDVSNEYKVDPRRTASLLDIFSCVFQGIIPYGAQLLSAAALTNATVTSPELYTSPAGIVGGMWYCWFLAAFGLLSIFVPYADGVCRRDPWSWEYGCAQSGVEAKKALLAQERDESESSETL